MLRNYEKYTYIDLESDRSIIFLVLMYAIWKDRVSGKMRLKGYT